MTKKLDKFVFITFTLFFVLFLYSPVSSHFICHYLYASSGNDLNHYGEYDINDYDNFYQDNDLILSKSDNLNYNSFSYANNYILQELTHASYLTPTLASAFFLPAATKLNLTLSALLLTSLAIYAGNKIFSHHNSLGGISSFDILNSSSSLPEDFEHNNLQKSQHSRSNFDNTHSTDPKEPFYVLPPDQDDGPSNKDPHLSDLKVDAETLELFRQRSQLKTEYKDALYYIDELKTELEKQRFKQKSKQVFIDYCMFILPVNDLTKKRSKQIFDDEEFFESHLSKALGELAKYSDYYIAYIANNEDAFLNPNIVMMTGLYLDTAKSLKYNYKKYNGFMDFYSLYDYKFKLLSDQMNNNDYPEITITDDINYFENYAKKVDRFDNNYTLKESITKLNQIIDLSKLTIAKLLIDIDKTQLSVIHSDIVSNILNSNIILNILHQQKELIRTTTRKYLSNNQKKQDLSAISQDILIASEKLSLVTNQLNSLYHEYQGIDYEPSKYPEISTKLKAIFKVSIYAQKQLADLYKKYKKDS